MTRPLKINSTLPMLHLDITVKENNFVDWQMLGVEIPGGVEDIQLQIWLLLFGYEITYL